MGRDSAYLRAFKDFTKSRPSVSAREDMEREFYGQNDRACGVLNASWVEQSLETAISRTLARPASKLFDTEGSFPTFSVKIQMAYALGLFGEKTNHDLLLIRTMRNGFAHCQLPLRFDIPEVKAVCDHLSLPDTDARVLPKVVYDSPVDDPEPWGNLSHPKTRFVVCCYTIIYHLFDDGRKAGPPPRQTSLP
jgi:hypothetical protein